MFPTGIASVFASHSQVASTPLSLDRLCTSPASIPASNFPIFRHLPIELHNQFYPYLTTDDLASLSLVDQACRQWVRGVQFRNVKFNHKDASLELVARLAREAKHALDGAQATPPDDEVALSAEMGVMSLGAEANAPSQLRSCPSRSFTPLIGPCIRRLVISTPPGILATQNPFTLIRLFPHSASVRTKCMIAAQESEAMYFRVLLSVIRWALPNLQVLDWQRRLVWTTEMEDVFTGMKALRHLRLGCVMLEDGWDRVGDTTRRDEWELETLVINVAYPVEETATGGNLTPFVRSLLTSCASSLSMLALKEWTGAASCGGAVIKTLSQELRGLHKLRVLVLDDIVVENLDVFLGMNSEPTTRVRTLTVDAGKEKTCQYLTTRGAIRSLENLYWLNYAPTLADDQPVNTSDTYQSILTFLSANPHLYSFATSSALPLPFITENLLPLLVAEFYNLTSLNLIFGDASIPDEALQTISTIPTLKHLWLSAGHQYGTRHTWSPSHSHIATLLLPLRHSLTSLVITRDAYLIETHPLHHATLDNYYSAFNPPRDVVFLASHGADHGDLGLGFDREFIARRDAQKRIWEQRHRDEMVKIVKGCYLGLDSRSSATDTQTSSVSPRPGGFGFEQLSWCYVGQLSMQIRRLEGCRSDDGVQVVVETEERDAQNRFLKSRWGIENEFPF
ncbi:hypothetical protein BDN72DRAFT_392137 [Pluteus cervinus]|uniref:Uncharacterized protein n=1 Tax=Pluteus cervinus TaxID=181527 RepID=A0ACD3A9Z0_9AGAR|nr:hypothetical protein BDN72DRAFT_392137 [Pluteus cervinus]